MNLPDFTFLLVVLVGPILGWGAAHGEKAGTGAIVLFTLGGLLLGLGMGGLSSKLSYSVLMEKKLSDGLRLFVSMLIPFLSLLVVLFVPFWLAWVIFE